VDGVDFKILKAVTGVLAKLEGVKDVQSLYLVGRRSLLSVTFSGDSHGLAERIAAADFRPHAVSVVGLSAYKIELEVSAPGRRPAAEDGAGGEEGAE
jgi:hypothetical protein